MRASERSRRHAVDDRDLDEADREHLRRRSGNAERDRSAGAEDLAAGLPPDLGRVLHLQRAAGNAAVADLLTVSRDDDDRMPAELAPFRSTAAIAPRDEAPTAGATRRYNERVRRGRAVDQESASGVLPFTPPAGWNGELIAGRLSQLSIAVPQTDAVECVEVSFLVGLVLSGPAAVRASIGRYLTTYRDLLGTRGLPRCRSRRPC